MTTQWRFATTPAAPPRLWSPILDLPEPRVESWVESQAQPQAESQAQPQAEFQAESQAESWIERRSAPTPSAQLIREHQRLMAQNIALKAQNQHLAAQQERAMTRMAHLSTQNNSLRQSHDRGELQLENLQRQLDRQRQRANIALDVQPVHAAANPNPAVRNARGHYVQQAFWLRKQHRPIVRTCLNLVAASLVVALSYALMVLVAALLAPGMVPDLLVLGLNWGRVILAIDLFSLGLAMVTESV
jgi:hypothetical protein